MAKYTLEIELLSDATFARGDGVAGLIDTEIQYDVETGLPYISGKTLKGLLVEECSNILYALGNRDQWVNIASALFGRPGSTLEDDGILHIASAQFPIELQQAVRYAIEKEKWSADDVLESLTSIRRQTSVNSETDAPQKGSLRSSRVLLRNVTLSAELTFSTDPTEEQLVLLTACACAVRRGGEGRNRGRGRLQIRLLPDCNFAFGRLLEEK